MNCIGHKKLQQIREIGTQISGTQMQHLKKPGGIDWAILFCL